MYESITGSLFRGMAMQEVEIAGGIGIIPQITGSAWITGLNEWILDETDPLCYGFLLGRQSSEQQNVREMLVQAAWDLFEEKGYADTQVADIAARAGVKEEEFYKYFSRKEDLEHTLGDLFDTKYAQLMTTMDPKLSNYDKLVFLNRELFTLIEEHVPFNLVSHIYVSMPGERQDLLNEKRFYYTLIPRIIEEGQKVGEFTREESAKEIFETYASLERGLIYDWCVKEGKESLAQKGTKLLTSYLKAICC